MGLDWGIVIGGIVAQLALVEHVAITESMPALRGMRWAKQRAALAVFGLDVVVLITATLVALTARSRLSFFEEARDLHTLIYPMAAFILVIWIGLITYMGGYRAEQFGAGMDEFRRVLNASLATAAGLGITAYLLQYPLSRGFYFLLFMIGIPALLLARVAARRVLQRLRA